MRGGWSRRLLLILGAFSSAGCDPVDVVVLDVRADPDGGGRPSVRLPCTDDAECPGDAFCEKPTCSDPLGACRRRPVFCPPEVGPVCGCNGVTYFNDCLRRRAWVRASSEGACELGAPCGGPDRQACPDADAKCARLSREFEHCAGDEPGSCWVLPAICPAEAAEAGTWAVCGQTASPCVDACEAIRAETPHHRRRPSTCP